MCFPGVPGKIDELNEQVKEGRIRRPGLPLAQMIGVFGSGPWSPQGPSWLSCLSQLSLGPSPASRLSIPQAPVLFWAFLFSPPKRRGCTRWSLKSFVMLTLYGSISVKGPQERRGQGELRKAKRTFYVKCCGQFSFSYKLLRNDAISVHMKMGHSCFTNSLRATSFL